MGKSFKVSTRESIPLPRSLREALITVPESFGYVSHTRFSFGKKNRKKTLKGGEQTVEEVWVPKKESVTDDGTPYLTSDNHAFYIGKFFPKTRNTRIAELLGWSDSMDYRKTTYEKDSEEEPKEHIYSEELIEATLSHLFAHLLDGEKAQIFVGPCLSDFINGKEETVGALSVDDEIALIRKIAKNKFPNFHEKLSIQKWDELPMHQDFFATMEECSDPSTGRCDAEKLFSLNDQGIEHGVTTLRIATCLARATEESKDLALKLRSTVPGRIRLNDDDEHVRDTQNYGIIEIALRLTELLQGRNIHSGAERQAVYDDVIIEIVKGSHGRYSKIKALKELLKVFERFPFETVHVDNKINPPVLRKIRDSARNRIAMVAISLAAILGGGAKMGQIHEQNEHEARQAALQAAVDNSIEERIKKVRFYFDYKWYAGSDGNLERFHSVVKDVMDHIKFRYNLSESVMEDLKIHLEEYVLVDMEESTVCHLDKEIPQQIQLADEFVRKRSYLFVAKGIKIQYPYEHLEKYAELLDKAQEENFSVSKEKRVDQGNFYYHVDNDNLRIIGRFKTGQGYAVEEGYELALFTTDDGEKHIVALKNPQFHDVSHHYPGNYTSENARAFACHYRKEKQLHEANKFYGETQLWHFLKPDNNWSEAKEEHIVEADDEYSLKKLGIYTVHPHGLKFEIARYRYHRKQTDQDHSALVARRLGDKGPFTTIVAREVAFYYREAQEKRWKMGNFCDRPEEDE